MQLATLNERLGTAATADTEPPDTLRFPESDPRPLPGCTHPEWGIVTASGDVLTRGGFFTHPNAVEFDTRQSPRAPAAWSSPRVAERWAAELPTGVYHVACLGEVLP